MRIPKQLQPLRYAYIIVLRPNQRYDARVFHYGADFRADLTNMVFRVVVHEVTKDDKTPEVHNQLLLLSARVNLTRAEDRDCYGICL